MGVDAKAFDVVVIGAGLAGFAAAMTCHERGKSVALLSRNTGASSVSSGAWDLGPLTGNQRGPLSERWESAQWKKNYGALLLETEGDIQSAVVSKEIETIGQFLLPDLTLACQWEKPFLAPTTMGFWKSAYVLQGVQKGSDLHALTEKGKIGLVAGAHWRFRADLLCQKWRAAADALGVTLDLQPMVIEEDGFGGDCPLPHVATRLAYDSHLKEAFVDKLKAKAQQAQMQHLLLPPLFLKEADAKEWESSIGVSISECLATMEPVAGLRLHEATRAAIQRASIPNYKIARITPVTSAENKIERLTIVEMGSQTSTDLAAKHFILATGKHFGGGIEMNYGEVREAVFDLPVYYEPGHPIQYRSELPSSEAPIQDDHDWSRLGLSLDAHYRPVDTTGTPIYDNVHACGSVIGGLDFAAHSVGLGFMAFSGRRCAENLV